jgi:3-methyladenine DNA glycosylase AlkC
MIKTNISLPDSIFEEARLLAEQLGLSFSEFQTKALQSYLRKYNRSSVLNQLNQIYSEQSSEIEPELTKMQFLSLKREDW